MLIIMGSKFYGDLTHSEWAYPHVYWLARIILPLRKATHNICVPGQYYITLKETCLNISIEQACRTFNIYMFVS